MKINRFSALITENTTTNRQPTNNNRQPTNNNIFKQLSQRPQQERPQQERPQQQRPQQQRPQQQRPQQERPQQERPQQQKNMFKQHEKAVFTLESENFPDLAIQISTINDKSKKKEVNYLEKIKQTREKLLEKEALVLPGWTLLYPKHVTNYCPKNFKKTIDNPYYAPHIAIKTMENRLFQRLELNDILGDISPYWDSDLFGEDLDELDDDDEEYLYDDMEDNEYMNNEFD